MATPRTIDVDVLRQLLDYDPETGVLTWRHRDASMFKDGNQSAAKNAMNWNRRHAGNRAFIMIHPDGYRAGALFNRRFLAHRVIWLLNYGEWPEFDIDHINGVRHDNRLHNLRSVTRQENLHNIARPSHNKSGTMGVCWDKQRSKWMASIKISGRNIYIGRFSSFEDAASARKEAEAHYGFHVNHGRPQATG